MMSSGILMKTFHGRLCQLLGCTARERGEREREREANLRLNRHVPWPGFALFYWQGIVSLSIGRLKPFVRRCRARSVIARVSQLFRRDSSRYFRLRAF